MFDIWRKIDEKGAVVVPTKETALSALGWVEISEEYPELRPEDLRGYDVYSDPQLIRESPFAPVVIKGTKSFHFKATDPIGEKSFDAWVDPMELAETFGRNYFHADDGESSFGGILVCSCGIAGCAGIWSQTFHVSEKMVHWSVVRYDDEFEFFFEREAYEKGVLTMMRALLERPDEFTLPGPDGWLYEEALEAFRSQVDEMLERRAYFRDMWDEICETKGSANPVSLSAAVPPLENKSIADDDNNIIIKGLTNG